MSTTSTQPRRQRLDLYQANHSERHKRFTLPLAKELRTRYSTRRIPVRKGDTVRILSGSYEGREERVTKVDYRNYRLVLDNITVKKADGKMKQLPIAPNHLLLTKLNLGDPWRRKRLKVPLAEEKEIEAAASEASPAAAMEEKEA